MANPSPSPQNLKEFAQNLLDDLRGGRMSPDEAVIASLQYPYLREFIHARRDEIAGALHDEEKLKAVLDGALTTAAATINRELPQFQVEKPDAQLSPSDIVARAHSFRAARWEVFAATRRQQASVGQLRKAFINRLVEQWIDQTRSLMENEKQKTAAGVLKTELEERLEDVSSFEEISTRVQHSLKNTLVAAGDAATIRREVGPAQRELVTATQKLAGLTAIPKELVLRASTPRPDWFTALAIQTISSTALPPAAAFARAASLTRTAEVISAPLVKEKDVTATGVFFRALGVAPTQKAFAAIADALFNQLSPFARQEVIKATFSHALEGVLAKTDTLTKALGQEFVESEFFRLAIDNARKEFARDAGAGAGVRQARGALDDVIGSLLRGPLVAPLVGNPKEMILSYLELLAVEARFPRDKKMFFPDHVPAVSVDAGPSSSAVLRAAASQLMQMLPSWQVFYVMLLASSPSITSVYQGGRSSSFGSIGSAPMSSIGGGINAALGWAGRGLSGVAFGLGGGLVGGVFGGGLGSFFNNLRGPRQPDRFFDDTPKLIAISVVVVIVLLFIFPSFINSTLTSRAAKYAALLVASQETPDFSGESNPSPDLSLVASECKGQDLPAPSADRVKTTQIGGRTYAFPVAPYDRTYYTCGHHDRLQATDIGINGVEAGEPHVGIAVVAYTDGVIETTELNDPKGGKYVILRGEKNSYYYAHNCALYVKRGDHVTAGQVIAATGNTGSAAGTPEHLHFAITAAGGDFYDGGDACPAKDFKEKFGISKCGAEPLCPPRPPKK